MILDFTDIVNQKRGFAHAQGLPEGVTLGTLFEKREDIVKRFGGPPSLAETDEYDLSQLLPVIMQVTINGRRADNWRDIRPGQDDRVHFTIGPMGEVLAIIAAVAAVISAIVSVVQLVLALTASPPESSQQGRRRDSDTYAFEGIRDTFTLGSPIGVTYGTHRKGGQVLMYYLTMMPQNKGTQMHMLLSMGEGPVESIEDVELNDLSITLVESCTSFVRLGADSQGFVPGFERIRNTFHEAQEITDKQINGLGQNSESSCIYRTKALDCEAGEFFIVAPNGCWKSLLTGKFRSNWSQYLVEYRPSHQASMSDAAAPWSTWETRRLTGKEPVPTWDFGQITFPRPGQWDVRFTWQTALKRKPTGRVAYAITLADFTEIRGPSQTFTGECLLAVNAAPTAQLHGGQPNVTAIVKGMKPRVYRTVSSYAVEWTDNPAWPMVDWMTNSKYGMGADIPIEDVDIQSFLDFASLAESLAETCTTSAFGGCPTFGTADFFDGGPLELSSLSPMVTDFSDPFVLRSKFHGIQQSGIVYCKPCCPPDYGYGVNSSDFLNSWLDESMRLRTDIQSGSPMFGLVNYVRSGTNQFSGNAYGWIFNVASSTAVLCRWKGSAVAINTYGTVLATHSWNPRSGDFYYLRIDQAYDLPSSYAGSNIEINYYVENGASFIDVDFIDSVATMIPFTNLDRAIGVISLPTSLPGDHHVANLMDFTGETGLCYAPIGHLGSHELTCVQAIPWYAT